MNNGKLVNQKRQGIKLNLRMNLFPCCFIVSDRLPSILWLLNTNGSFSTIYLFICNELCCEKFIKEWWESVIIIKNVKDAVQLLSDASVFKFGIGNIGKLWTIWKELCGLKLSNTILICDYDRIRQHQFKDVGVNWTRICHSSVGGVTRSRWLIGVPCEVSKSPLINTITNWGLRRRLGSIIDEGLTGKVISPPKNLHHLSLLPKLSGEEILDLPSYRSKSGWVKRSLSFKERALILDFNEIIISKLEGDCNYQKVAPWILEGKLVPNKIMQIGIDWMLNIWGEKHEMKKQNLDKIIQANRPKSEGEIAGKDNYLDFERNYLVMYGEKAAKNDDEKVPIELWDRYILRRHFEWLNYSPTVARALEIIRNKIAFR